MFLIIYSLCPLPCKSFQANLMFVSKARSGVPERCFTRVGSNLTHKHYTKLEKSARDKHSSLSQTFVNYSCKKFCNIGPCTSAYCSYNCNLLEKEFYNVGPWFGISQRREIISNRIDSLCTHTDRIHRSIDTTYKKFYLQNGLTFLLLAASLWRFINENKICHSFKLV